MFHTYKKQIIIISILVVLTVTSLAIYSYINSFQFITIKYRTSEGTVKLYDASKSDGEPLRTVASNEQIKIKKGNYTLKWTGEHITLDKQSLQVKDIPVTETIIFTYSDQYLAELLKKDYSLITNRLNQSYPNISSLYTVSRAKLYDRGEWFGAILTYKGKDGNNRDTLRVIAKKDDGEWNIVSDPPSLLLSTKEYPNVPQNVIQDINLPAPLPGTLSSPPLTAEGLMNSPYN